MTVRGPRRIRFSAVRRWVVAAGSALLSCWVLAGTASADLLSGNAEWDYSLLNTKTKKPNAPDSTGKADTITQRYHLSLDATPFPNLRFSAGSLVELGNNSSDTDGATVSSSTSTYYPYADVMLGTRLYNAGFGYSRKMDSFSGTGSPDSATINEEYHAVFGWKPEGFPSTTSGSPGPTSSMPTGPRPIRRRTMPRWE